MAKATQVKTESANLPASWDQLLHDQAVAQAARKSKNIGGGNKISVRGKGFTFQKLALGNPLELVIVNFSYTNQYYDTPYNPDQYVPPACYAKSMTEDELAPFANSPKAQGSATPDEAGESCTGCWANAFGSAAQGRGKACSNRVSLVVIDPAGVVKEACLLEVAPKGLKNFFGYQSRLEKVEKLPLFGVTTLVSFSPGDAFPVLTFTQGTKLDKASPCIPQIMSALAQAQEMLLAEVDCSTYGQEQAAPQRGGQQRRAIAPQGKRPVKQFQVNVELLNAIQQGITPSLDWARARGFIA